MVTLYNVSVSAIHQNLKRIFEDNELILMIYPILRNIKAIKCCVLKVMSYIIEKCLIIDMGP